MYIIEWYFQEDDIVKLKTNKTSQQLTIQPSFDLKKTKY